MLVCKRTAGKHTPLKLAGGGDLRGWLARLAGWLAGWRAELRASQPCPSVRPSVPPIAHNTAAQYSASCVHAASPSTWRPFKLLVGGGGVDSSQRSALARGWAQTHRQTGS